VLQLLGDHTARPCFFIGLSTGQRVDTLSSRSIFQLAGLELAKTITLLGSVGVGLVWGWLLGGLGDTAQRRFSNVLSVFVATLLLGTEVYLFASWTGAGLFLGALSLALLLHLGWRCSLRQRFNQST